MKGHERQMPDPESNNHLRCIAALARIISAMASHSVSGWLCESTSNHKMSNAMHHPAGLD